MSSERLKIVWLCHFSNERVHNHLELGDKWVKRFIRRVIRKPLNTTVSDYAVWISNGICEFEKINTAELHIISPYPYLKNCVEEYEENGVFYHFFKNEDELVIKLIYNLIFHPRDSHYSWNRRVVKRLIHRIKPEIVHLFGAENPYYSMSLLDIPHGIITITQLQTLLCDQVFEDLTPNSFSYKQNARIERRIIQRTDFVGTVAVKYREIIQKSIKPDVRFINTTLPLFEPIVHSCDKTVYDFVYFSANISKGADLALEAFGRAYSMSPGISLNIIGSYDSSFRRQLDVIIEKYGISEAVTFAGSLPTHEDVLRQIRKSRFALLPLRVDLTSSTIREAMSNGLPVITTDSGLLGTQKLNSSRQNVLLSPIGDHQALADNMLRLLRDEDLAEKLRNNAYQTRSEAKTNESIIRHYIRAYKACLSSMRKQIPLPDELSQV